MFRYLDRCNDLANLALCSRRFNRGILPILHSSFTDDNALLRTIPFLSTILERSDLARYVKELAFNGRDFTYLIPDNEFNQYIHKIDQYMDRIEATMMTALDDTILFNSSKLRLV